MTIPQPTAFYRFESNGDDSSGNNYHLEDDFGTHAAAINGNGMRGTFATDQAYAEQLLPLEGDFSIAFFCDYPVASQEDVTVTFEWSTAGLVSRIFVRITADSDLNAAVSDAEDTQFKELGTVGGQNQGAPGWHHVAITQSGTTIKLYVDGVLRDTDTRNPFSTAAITGFSVATAYSALIDNLYIFNGTALDASQVAELYNGGAGYEYSPPVQRSPDEFYYLMF